MAGTVTGEHRRTSGALLVLGLLLVAANLRATLTSAGPLLDAIAADTGVSTAALGLLTTLPLLAFAIVSPLAHNLSGRFGLERTIFTALLVLIGGTVFRSLEGSIFNLWAGSFITGAAIAICNVLVPAVIKRDFPTKMASLTGAYSAVLGSFAGLGAGLAVPLATVPGSSWRWAMAAWALLVVPAVLVWLPQLRRKHPGRPDRATVHDGSTAAKATAGPGAPAAPAAPPAPTAPTPLVWKSATAWQVTLYMGLQSATFYILITWLPSIVRTFGRSDVESGWDVFLFQALGIAGSLLTPLLLNRGRDQRFTAATPPVLLLLSMLGIVFLPDLLLLWVVISGFCCGSSLVSALSFFGLRTHTHRQASALSSMGQSIGYLLAACGPVLFGAVYGVTDSWTLPLQLLALIGVAQATAGLAAGRNRYVAPA
ncbi:CynX/NimT family MFS transporter [Arthrobacter castelli]|uniref:CynX/NimT family MFS transporter n=1 Tax=Arthrobacter castelli TaxID=271431 RepID=UPI0004259581|nr:MFS transporter [Arthrobacter castelli]